jgi:plastocyanin
MAFQRCMRRGRSSWRAALTGVLEMAALPAVADLPARIHAEPLARGGSAEGAVLSLHSPQAAALAKPQDAVMDQRARRFEPDLRVVAPGSRVAFPNSDNIRHHVYSFSV